MLDGASPERNESSQRTKQSCLAAAAGTDQRYKLTLTEFEGHIAKRVNQAGAAPVSDAEIAAQHHTFPEDCLHAVHPASFCAGPRNRSSTTESTETPAGA